MRRENLNLFIAMLIIGFVIIGGYFFLRNSATNSTSGNEPIESIQTPPPNEQNSFNPNYGDLTDEQIRIADIAVGKLLNSSEGITPPMISVVNFEEQDFSNTALGCPQPDQMYAEVITHGYQVVLEAQGIEYDYRLTDENNVFLCEQ